MIKAQMKLGPGIYHKTTRAIHISHTFSQHCTKWGKTEIISFKVRNNTRVSILPTLIQHSTEIPCQNIRQDNERKQIQ
jgi:hypothetical protein